MCHLGPYWGLITPYWGPIRDCRATGVTRVHFITLVIGGNVDIAWSKRPFRQALAGRAQWKMGFLPGWPGGWPHMIIHRIIVREMYASTLQMACPTRPTHHLHDSYLPKSWAKRPHPCSERDSGRGSLPPISCISPVMAIMEASSQRHSNINRNRKQFSHLQVTKLTLVTQLIIQLLGHLDDTFVTGLGWVIIIFFSLACVSSYFIQHTHLIERMQCLWGRGCRECRLFF